MQNKWLKEPRLKLFFTPNQRISEEKPMTSFNERLPVPPAEKAQVWIVGDRDQVAHLIDEFYVRRIATDFPSETLRERTKFTPIVPAPFAKGKFMSVLVR
jgi:hypothetical protein